MAYEAWMTLGIVALVLGLLAFTRFAADTVLVGGLGLLMLTGVLDPSQALAGFANDGMITVGILFVVATGLSETGAFSLVVPRLLGQALEGRDLTVYGDGLQSRCFTYVSDIVEWLLLLGENDKAVGEVYNLGNPEEVTITELAQRILTVTGSQSGITYIP